ncbi:hypothetical protein GW17_00050956, partial [Ensete ventricosum]
MSASSATRATICAGLPSSPYLLQLNLAAAAEGGGERSGTIIGSSQRERGGGGNEVAAEKEEVKREGEEGTVERGVLSQPDEESCVRKGHLHGHAPNRLLSGILQTGWPVVFGLSCRQSPAIRGATSWSTCRIWSATLPAPYWQGCRRLADPLRLLCPVVGQLSIGVLPCYRLPVV